MILKDKNMEEINANVKVHDHDWQLKDWIMASVTGGMVALLFCYKA